MHFESMSMPLKNAVDEKIELMKSVPRVFKYVLLGDGMKKFLFVLWLLILIITPLYWPYYNEWKLENEFAASLTGIILDAFRVLFFSLWMFWYLLGDRLHRIVNVIFAVLFASALTIVPFILLKNVSEDALEIYNTITTYFFLGLAALCTMMEKWQTIERSAPAINYLTRILHFAKKNVHPLRFMVVEIIGYLLLKEFLIYLYLPDFILDSQYFGDWRIVDYILNTVVFLWYFMIRKRNDFYHHQLKIHFIWILPIVQLWGILNWLNLFFEELSNGISYPLIISLCLLIFFSVWSLAITIGEEMNEGKTPATDPKLYASVLWLYMLILYSTFNDIIGLGELLPYFAFWFSGVGVIMLFRNLAKNTAKHEKILNFSVLNFITNNMKTINGISLKK
jgi:hypothetical protein